MIPRRTAIVQTVAYSGNIPASDGRSARTEISLARMPWEPEVTGPDPREETRPRNTITMKKTQPRNQPTAEETGIMDLRGCEF